MSKDSFNVISSAECSAGPTPSVSPGGHQMSLFGQAPVRASRSRLRAKGRALLTNGIYGPTFSDSSAPAVPQSSWESRLRERLGTLGSTEYDLTWREKVTPAGRSIFRLAPSTRRTGGTGCTGWPSPVSSPNTNRKTRSCPVEIAGQHGLTLAGVAHDLTGWPTPNTPSGGPNTKSTATHTGGLDLEGAVRVCGWPTASARDWRDPRASAETMAKNARPLNEVAGMVVGWTTPQAHDTSPGNPERVGRHGTVHGDRNLNDEAAQLAGWGTPRAATNSGIPCPEHTGKGSRLEDQAAELVGWKTPLVPSGGRRNPPGTTLQGRRPDGKKVTVDLREEALAVSGTPGNLPDQTRKENSGGLGALNPEFVGWLMMGDLWPEIMACAPSACSRKVKRKG